MLRKFESNIDKNQLFHKQHRLLLAVSGGIDSVSLAHLLKQGGFNFSLAHCNFKLRDKDSDKDEQFCVQLAKEWQVKIFTKIFDTKVYADKQGQSIQMAARHLRYEWFDELMNEHRFDYLLTAHHAGDVVETVFINLLRGTGIKGMKGIAEKNGKLIRPLLPFTKEEIKKYASEKKIKFRTDKSNLEDKYERNFLRLNVIPKLKKLNPNLETTFLENGFRFTQESEIVNNFLSHRAKTLLSGENGTVSINKSKLKQEKYQESLLHFLLGSYGFNVTQQQNILANINNNSLSGKLFDAKNHTLTIARNAIVIQEKKKQGFEKITIASLDELKKQDLFRVATLKLFTFPKKNELIVDANQLIFPLQIRVRKTGDRFKPFGMRGFKLLSDFMKSEKLNAFEKENCKLLVNGNAEIIWVLGYRSDERYRVTKREGNYLKLTLRD